MKFLIEVPDEFTTAVEAIHDDDTAETLVRSRVLSTVRETMRKHVQQNESGFIDGAVQGTNVAPEWVAGESVEVGDLRHHEGVIYRCVQDHTTQADWTPDATPALWEVV